MIAVHARQSRRPQTKESKYMKCLFLAAVAAMAFSDVAVACSPAPSCWMNESPAYLRSICAGYAKDRKTLKQIAEYVDEPENIAAFGKACKKFKINLRSQ
jgi:hypothetical protein